MTPEDAFSACEAITRSEAKNFAYGIRLLRPPERRALSAVYALARRIDDIGDGDQPVPAKLAGLAEIRRQLGELAAGGVPGGDTDPVMTAVALVAERYPLPLDAFVELVGGCEMDVVGTRYATFDDLVGYCRAVAGTIGRLSLGIFEARERDRAAVLADDLGVALQLTNILRDVVEDRQMGRVYLPAADAEACGAGGELDGPPDALAALVAVEAGRAAQWYDRGLELLPLLDRRSRACVAAMAGIYRQLLERISADPLAVTRGRLALSGWQKAWVAGRSLVGSAT
ncbi:MAG: squalene/phytoene synthase family protein [Actinomycetota bacterium]|nr:squalene/phytoene synthase family protein [Actinomycetota bacterium]